MASLVSGTTSDMTPRPSRRAFYTGDRFQAAAFIVPSCIFLALLTIWPFFYSVYLSLHRVRLTALKRAVFVGFENYWNLVTDTLFQHALLNTLMLATASIACEIIIGFVVAKAFVSIAHLRWSNWLRSFFLMPMIYMAWSLKYGAIAGNNPWQATGLEWQIQSPPLTENFIETPIVDFEAYDFEWLAQKTEQEVTTVG